MPGGIEATARLEPGAAMPAAWLRWSGTALAAVAWLSAALFGLYITFFYAGAIAVGSPEQWNETLPGLFAPENRPATAGIAAHFAAGGIVLLLGPIQLIGAVRRRWPAFHRWTGRLYVLAAATTGAGGLAFIFAEGTIGGWAMDVGFGLYGALVILAAVQAFRHARARRFDRHRAWAIRLFALAIGSWLYRMDYGFWYLIADAAGHQSDYRGWFDRVMNFAFYVPNLVLAEAFIRARAVPERPALQAGGSLLLGGGAALIALATWQFARLFWIPGIVLRLAG